jgi:mannitol/fructose-specific phosphotransferase system IIA component (Ntr-type)
MSALEVAETLGFPLVTLPGAASRSTESAISFLVNQLIQSGLLLDTSVDEMVGRVLQRERLGSTAFGNAAALPHSTCSAVDRVIGILARCPHPVPWQAPDRQCVRTICLILGPVDKPRDYIRALEKVVRAMKALGESLQGKRKSYVGFPSDAAAEQGIPHCGAVV